MQGIYALNRVAAYEQALLAFHCPHKEQPIMISLFASSIETPLGPMLAISDEKGLYLLEFFERRHLERGLEKLQIKTKSAIIPGCTSPLQSIEQELKEYFEGQLREFKTPLHILGTPFQQQVWQTLMNIPYGETKSYGEQATDLGKPSAARAVANANSANQHAIVIPCHRIIQSNGALGGYAGGIYRKQWLLHHEKNGICRRSKS